MEGCSGSHAVFLNSLGAHALSGCDNVIGIGKATVLKRLMTFTDNLSLGDLSASLDEVTDSCLRFVATKEQGTSLNSMHADIFKRETAASAIYHPS